MSAGAEGAASLMLDDNKTLCISVQAYNRTHVCGIANIHAVLKEKVICEWRYGYGKWRTKHCM